jgi:hypothetical protein
VILPPIGKAEGDLNPMVTLTAVLPATRSPVAIVKVTSEIVGASVVPLLAWPSVTVTLKVPISRFKEFPNMSCALIETVCSPLTTPDAGNVQETLCVAFMASPDTRVKEWLGQYDMPLPRELRQ